MINIYIHISTNIRYIHKPESPQNTSLCSSTGNFSIPDSDQQLISFFFCLFFVSIVSLLQAIHRSKIMWYPVFCVYLFIEYWFMYASESDTYIVYLNSSLCVLIFNCMNHFSCFPCTSWRNWNQNKGILKTHTPTHSSFLNLGNQ